MKASLKLLSVYGDADSVIRTGGVCHVGQRGNDRHPTAMMIGPDGNLYISNFGYFFGGGSGLGQVGRVDLP